VVRKGLLIFRKSHRNQEITLRFFTATAGFARAPGRLDTEREFVTLPYIVMAPERRLPGVAGLLVVVLAGSCATAPAGLPRAPEAHRPLWADSDGDGVPDRIDRCPAEAEDRDGFQDADGCPEIDNDGDLVSDARDRCPLVPEDLDGFQDDDGCPDPDNDRDGILDAADRCPDQPGLPADGGCPARFRYIAVEPGKIELRGSILFVDDGPVLMSASQPVLDEVAEALRSRPDLRLRVEGHTASRGARRRNVRNSQAQANAVRAYLIRHGIEGMRVEARGLGPDQPIETNKTASGRDKNRRIELVITQP
jgi:outer membrane protein OmpA-like peptidoglycan-associated protein